MSNSLPEYRMPPSRCPHCGITNDGATGLHHQTPPQPGMFSVCTNCAQLVAFDDRLRLRKLTDQELGSVMLNAGLYMHLRKVQNTVRTAHKKYEVWKN